MLQRLEEDKIMELIRKEIGEMAPYQIPKLLDAEVKLNQNESPFNIPEELIEKIKNKMGTIQFNRYNEGSSNKLREAISEKFNVSPEQVIIGAGIDELLYYITLAFVNKGDKIVRPVPSFSMYEICAKIGSARDVPVELDEKFELTKEFEKESKDAKLVFICRPNNPTSNSFSKKTIERIIKSCKGIVCIDEAYAEFSEEDCREFLRYENVILLRTFSKLYSAAAIRLGYGIASEKIIENLNRVKLPWNVSLITQIIGELLLEEKGRFEKNIKEIKKNREILIKGLENLGIRTIPSDANFVLFEVENPKRIFRALLQSGVLIRDVSNYPNLEKYLRVSVGTEKEVRLFLEALKKAVVPVDSIIFDVDGVLVDVSNSYRQAIMRTVQYFTGKDISQEEINEIKKIPGFNNDWDVSYALSKGIRTSLKNERNSGEYSRMKEYFQKIYLGELIENETPLISKETLEELKNRGIRLGIVTSRPRKEALFILRKFNISPEYIREKNIIALEDCEEEKPSPKPLILARENLGVRNPIFIGDTESDRLSARRAGIRFVFCNKVNRPPTEVVCIRNLKKRLQSGGSGAAFNMIEDASSSAELSQQHSARLVSGTEISNVNKIFEVLI